MKKFEKREDKISNRRIVTELAFTAISLQREMVGRYELRSSNGTGAGLCDGLVGTAVRFGAEFVGTEC